MQKYIHFKENKNALNADEDKNLNSTTDLNAKESSTTDLNAKESSTDIQQKQNKEKEKIKKQLKQNLQLQQKNYNKKLVNLNFQKSKKNSINLNSNIENTIPTLLNPRTTESFSDIPEQKVSTYNEIKLTKTTSEGFQNRKRNYPSISKFSFRNTNEFPIEINE